MTPCLLMDPCLLGHPSDPASIAQLWQTTKGLRFTLTGKLATERCSSPHVKGRWMPMRDR
jgi:hypothetical protein